MSGPRVESPRGFAGSGEDIRVSLGRARGSLGRARAMIGLGLVCGAVWSWGPASAVAQEPGTVVAADERVQGRSYLFPETGAEIPYALFVPEGYDGSEAWPLIVGLHGLGRPYDWLMGYEGLLDFAERDGFLMVTPLGYHPRAWYGSRGPGIPPGLEQGAGAQALPENLGELSERDVMNVLEIVRAEFNIDPDRIYLWGHSMGGSGTYHLASRYPDVWAGLAVAAPAGWPEVERLEEIRHLPVLVLHGDADATVSVATSRARVEKMRELGMQHLYIEVPGGDHSLFISRDPEMLSKIFSFFGIVSRGSGGDPGL